MGLGKIFEEIKDLVTGTPEEEAPQSADVNADSAYDQEQGIQPSTADPYGDPADQH